MPDNTDPPKTTTDQRAAGKQSSTPAIEFIRRTVDILRPWELSQNQRLRTYEAMLRDDAVAAGVEIRTVLIETSQSNGYFKYDRNNEVSKEVAKYFRYCMDNMDTQTPRSVGADASEFIYKGFAPFEFVGKPGKGDYADKWVIKKLSYVDPLSLHQDRMVEIPEGGDEITFLRQNSNAFMGNLGKIPNVSRNSVVPIPWKKIFYCSYSSTSSQPLGTSILDACYTAWREKVLLQDYTLIGVTKDFAGTPILYLPPALLENAAQDPNSLDAKTLDALRAGMANMHTGDQNYMILPSNTQSETGTGLRDYEIKFLGVEGGNKAFDVDALVEQRRKAILTVLGASNLITGENGGGSYNLLEGQSNIQAHYAERDTSVVGEMWNKQIFPKLLKLNNWEVSNEDMPKWVAGELQPLSHKEFTSGIQKLGAAGALPIRDVNFINEVLERSEYHYRIDPNDPNWLDKMSGNTSRAGDGMKEGLNNGTGTSTSKGGDRSISNKDNS